jgi:hypothetical protein
MRGTFSDSEPKYLHRHDLSFLMSWAKKQGLLYVYGSPKCNLIE